MRECGRPKKLSGLEKRGDVFEGLGNVIRNVVFENGFVMGYQ
jgi:hypothetical protein